MARLLCDRREFFLMLLGELGEADRILPGELTNVPGDRERGAGSKGDRLRNQVLDGAEIHFTVLCFCRPCQFGPPFVRGEFVIANRPANGSTDRFRYVAIRE